jgi:uncharacterized protein (UPF0218 family)
MKIGKPLSETKTKKRTRRKMKQELGIRIVRITSGEELLTKVSYDTVEKSYTIKKAAVLVPGQEHGQLAIVPWIPYANQDDGVVLQQESVIFCVKAMKELEDEYNSIFSNIIVPDNSLSTASLKLSE